MLTRARLTTLAIFISLLSACGGGGGGGDGGGDSTAPEVSAVTPSDGATAVEPDKAPTAEFNEDILGTSVDASSVRLTRDGEEQASTVSFNGASNTVTITPDEPLALLGEYQVTLDASITDLAGNPMQSSRSWGFSIRDSAWGTAETIEQRASDLEYGNRDNVNLQIAVNEAGNAFAVWREFTGTRFIVRADRFTPDKGWGNAETIEADNPRDAFEPIANTPKIAVDDDGNAMAVWVQNSTSLEIRANRFTPDNGWGTAKTIEAVNTGNAFRPQIAVDDDSNAMAVWQKGPIGSFKIRASRFTPDNGWSAAETIEDDNDRKNSLTPQIAVDDDGNALVVWKQGEDEDMPRNILANRFTPNNGWSTPETIESAPGNAEDPQVAVDGAGNALAVWRQNDGSPVDIRANRFDNTAPRQHE